MPGQQMPNGLADTASLRFIRALIRRRAGGTSRYADSQGDAGGRAQDSSREGGADGHQEAAQVAGAEEGDEDAGEAGGRESQWQGRQDVAAAADDGGERPGEEAQECPEGEEEQNEDEAGFEGHGDRVGCEGATVKGRRLATFGHGRAGFDKERGRT